jgi:uncharacterized protein (DUF697 family)
VSCRQRNRTAVASRNRVIENSGRCVVRVIPTVGASIRASSPTTITFCTDVIQAQ